jgi:galactarate dehydratase
MPTTTWPSLPTTAALPAGTRMPDGLTAGRQAVPQGHKLALQDLPRACGAPLQRRDRPRSTPSRPAAGCTNGCWHMPAARSLDGLPMATRAAPALPPLEGYTFEGYRNADGSVGTRNILAITTTVQCVAGVLDLAVKRIKDELLPSTPRWTTWSGWSTATAAAWPSTRPTPSSRSARCATSAQNPNFGGEVMVVSLGCEKLQPERLLPPGRQLVARSEQFNANSTCRARAAETRWTWSACRMQTHMSALSR